MTPVKMHTKYLGLPMIDRNNRMETFKDFEQKMNRKVSDWKNKVLSWAAKEVLVKSCLQSIPLYAMSCLQFPKSVSKELSRLTLNFWWNSDTSPKAIYWIRKETMYKSKSVGGLGFRCFESMNTAMLTKHLWQILTNPNLLISKIFKQGYFRNTNLLHIKKKRRDSYVWKSIAGTIAIFKNGLQLRNDNEWTWKFNGSGEYSVKSSYDLARKWNLSCQLNFGEVSDPTTLNLIWNRLWRTRVLDRVKLVSWRLFHNSLPLFVNLRRRGWNTDQGCAFCGFKNETNAWNSANNWFIDDWIRHILAVKDLMSIRLVLDGIWTIWYNRNLIVHGRTSLSIEACHFKAMQYLSQYESRNLKGNGSSQSNNSCMIYFYSDGSRSVTTKNGGWAFIAVVDGQIIKCKAEFNLRSVSIIEELQGMLQAL